MYVNALNHLTNSWKHSQYALGTKLKKLENELNGDDNLPTEYRVEQNCPNPFNPSTEIKYQLPEKNHVKLIIYDVIGNKVATLIDQIVEPGYHSVLWDASKYASGVYFYSFRSGSYNATKKLMLLK